VPARRATAGTEPGPKRFQPANVDYGLFPDLPETVREGNRRAAYAARARADISAWAVRNRVAFDLRNDLALA
jgi:folate-dependent tRNA-U54 methylase TrmFO/GidA